MEIGLKLSSADTSPLVDETMYRHLMGSLIFVPGLASLRWLLLWENTTIGHEKVIGMQGFKCLVCEGDTSIWHHLVFGRLLGQNSPQVCDSRWAGDIDTKHLVTGWCFMMVSKSISWISKKWPTVALYKAAYLAAYEVLLPRWILEDMGAKEEQHKVLHYNSHNW